MRACVSRLEAAIGLGLVLAVGISLFQFGVDCAAVRGEVLRIHILADSDAEADQALKLQVRDAVLEDLAGWIETDGRSVCDNGKRPGESGPGRVGGQCGPC